MTVVVDDLHDGDLAAWCRREAALLRAGKLDDLDALAIADELAVLLATEHRILRDHVRELLAALLLWSYDADLRCHARFVDVDRLRDAVGRLLEGSPSLRPGLGDIVAEEYPAARHEAEIRIGWLLDNTLPEGCPFTIDEIITPDQLPDPHGVDRERGEDWWKNP